MSDATGRSNDNTSTTRPCFALEPALDAVWVKQEKNQTEGRMSQFTKTMFCLSYDIATVL
jgi:hypothetical protein